MFARGRFKRSIVFACLSVASLSCIPIVAQVKYRRNLDIIKNYRDATLTGSSGTEDVTENLRLEIAGLRSRVEASEMSMVGSIVAYAGVNDLLGYILCDGRPVSRIEFRRLFETIFITYGPGDGVSTFNIPNMTGRFVVGSTDDMKLGSVGGEVEHTLTANEMPSHTHVYWSRSAGRTARLDTGYSSVVESTLDGVYLQSDSAGGNNAHNNMPPYIALKWFIKF